MVLNGRQSLDRFLLRMVDVCLAGTIFFVPLLMGGRHAAGHLTLTILAVGAALAWAIHKCLDDDGSWRPAVATPLLLLGAGLVALQIVPLPPWLLAWLAPRVADSLPLWNPASPQRLGCWSCISFIPSDTLAGLIVFLDLALLFLVAVQRIRRVEDVERLLRWCAMAAIGMATFGLAQYFTSNGKFLWFYDYPFSTTNDVTHGSFSNRNHFAQFMALGVGPVIWWLQDAMRRRRTGGSNSVACFLGVGLGVVWFAGMLSLSRGGMSAMLLATAIAAVVCSRTVSLGRFLGAIAAAGVLIGVALSIFGLDRVGVRIDDLSSGSLKRMDEGANRRTIWAAALRAIPDYAPLGGGVGSFREVYPRYTNHGADSNIEYTYAENSYLNLGVDAGPVGLALALASIVLCGWWCLVGISRSESTRLRTCAAAAAAGLAASAAHGLCDFVWYAPGCMTLVAILAACALRVRQLSRDEPQSNHSTATNPLRRTSSVSCSPHHAGPRTPHFAIPLAKRPFRVGWAAAAATLACGGVWMIAQGIGPAVAQVYWDAYLVGRSETSLDAVSTAASSATPPTPVAASTLEQQIACLDHVVAWQPTHLRAHLALAESHCRLFEIVQAGSENPMSLPNIRDAAVQSHFPSRAALDEWMSRAIGPHWRHLDQALAHVREALALCPLEGRAYVYLADLAFLNGVHAATRHAYIAQALLVRPFDGAVLYAAASEALAVGDHARWFDYAKQAFHASRLEQRRIIADLVACSSTENLPAVAVAILQEFQPDRHIASLLQEACGSRCTPELRESLFRYRAEKTEAEGVDVEPSEAALVFLDAFELFAKLDDRVSAARCLGKAVEADPGNYDARARSATYLLRLGMAAEAEPHVRWCLARRPDSKEMASLLRELLKQQTDVRDRAAETGGPIQR